MVQSQCPLCGGTGWQLVERADAEGQRASQRKDPANGAPSRSPKPTYAVPCECSKADRASRNLARARIPRRYEHCDFENFEIDVWEGGPEGPDGIEAWPKPRWWCKLLREITRRAERAVFC